MCLFSNVINCKYLPKSSLMQDAQYYNNMFFSNGAVNSNQLMYVVVIDLSPLSDVEIGHTLLSLYYCY